MSDSLQISRSGRVARVALDRPDLHNAFDDQLIADLTRALDEIGGDADVRAVVLSGNGASFSAGANIQWMRRMAQASEADNQAESDEQCGFHEPCLYAIRIGSIRSRGSRRRILDRNKERTH